MRIQSTPRNVFPSHLVVQQLYLLGLLHNLGAEHLVERGQLAHGALSLKGRLPRGRQLVHQRRALCCKRLLLLRCFVQVGVVIFCVTLPRGRAVGVAVLRGGVALDLQFIGKNRLEILVGFYLEKVLEIVPGIVVASWGAAIAGMQLLELRSQQHGEHPCDGSG